MNTIEEKIMFIRKSIKQLKKKADELNYLVNELEKDFQSSLPIKSKEVKQNE